MDLMGTYQMGECHLLTDEYDDKNELVLLLVEDEMVDLVDDEGENGVKCEQLDDEAGIVDELLLRLVE